MKLSVLQLNINADNFWNRLVPFLKEQSFDILQLQEVTGEGTIIGNLECKHDVFAELQKILKGNYEGVLSVTQRFTSSHTSYFANATFYNKSFRLKDNHELTLYHETEFHPSDALSYEHVGRRLLHLILEKEGQEISFLNIHFAWGPTPKERLYQTEQGDKLVHYLNSVKKPFVLTGDFNLTSDQPTIQKVEKLAVNLTKQNHITNTLNPRLHRAKELFPQGLAVDYIFASEGIKVKSFDVIEKDLSDHLGLVAEIEVSK